MLHADHGKALRKTFSIFSILLITVVLLGSTGSSESAHVKIYQYSFGIEGSTVPLLMPGTHGNIHVLLYDHMPAPITDINFTAEIYMFVNLATNTSYPVNSANIPLFNGTSGDFSTVIPEMAGSYNLSIPVYAGSNVSAGSYLVRYSISFFYNGSGLVFRSKGYFSSALWNSATSNGTVNYSMLGINGILPEASITVRNSTPSFIVYGILVLAVILFASGIAVYYLSVRKKNFDAGKKHG